MPLDDDAPITDDCLAFRLVRPDWVKPDRPASATFQDHPEDGKMSVFLSDGIENAEKIPAQLLEKNGGGYRLCFLTVGELRALGEVVTRSHNDFFPGHADCKNVNGQRSTSIRKKMAKQAKWFD